MDYKRLIIEMIEQMENKNYLKKIYDFISIPFRLEKMNVEMEKGD